MNSQSLFHCFIVSLGLFCLIIGLFFLIIGLFCLTIGLFCLTRFHWSLFKSLLGRWAVAKQLLVVFEILRLFWPPLWVVVRDGHHAQMTILSLACELYLYYISHSSLPAIPHIRLSDSLCFSLHTVHSLPILSLCFSKSQWPVGKKQRTPKLS